MQSIINMFKRASQSDAQLPPLPAERQMMIDYTDEFKSQTPARCPSVKARLEEESQILLEKKASLSQEALDFNMYQCELNRKFFITRRVQTARLRTARGQAAKIQRERARANAATRMEMRQTKADQLRACHLMERRANCAISSGYARVIAEMTKYKRKQTKDNLKREGRVKQLKANVRRQLLVEAVRRTTQKHNAHISRVRHELAEKAEERREELASEQTSRVDCADNKHLLHLDEAKRKATEHIKQVEDKRQRHLEKERAKTEALERTMDLKCTLAESNRQLTIYEKKQRAERNTRTFVRTWAVRWEQENAGAKAALDGVNKRDLENEGVPYF